jgi:hypothetical protein
MSLESGCDDCGKKAPRYYDVEGDKLCLDCKKAWEVTPVFSFLGHRIRVVEIDFCKDSGIVRYKLECRCTGCCTTPYGLRIECTEEDLEEIKDIME